MDLIPLTTPNQPTLINTDAIILFAAFNCHIIIVLSVLACTGREPYAASNPRERDTTAGWPPWRVARAGWWQKFARRMLKSAPAHGGPPKRLWVIRIAENGGVAYESFQIKRQYGGVFAPTTWYIALNKMASNQT